MIADLKKKGPRSILSLKLCSHNPTEVDPTFDQWK